MRILVALSYQANIITYHHTDVRTEDATVPAFFACFSVQGLVFSLLS